MDMYGWEHDFLTSAKRPPKMVVSTGDIWSSARRNNEAPKAWSFFKLLDLDAGDVFFLLRFFPRQVGQV